MLNFLLDICGKNTKVPYWLPFQYTKCKEQVNKCTKCRISKPIFILHLGSSSCTVVVSIKFCSSLLRELFGSFPLFLLVCCGSI